MSFLGLIGLAIANVLASVIHTFSLYWIIGKKIPSLNFANITLPVIKIIFASIIMGCSVGLVWSGVNDKGLDPKLAAMIGVFILIPSAVIFYFILLWATRFDELKGLWAFIVNVLKRE